MLIGRPAERAPSVLGPLSAGIEADGFPTLRIDSSHTALDDPLAAVLWAYELEDDMTGAGRMRQLLAHSRFDNCEVLFVELTTAELPAWVRLLQELEPALRAREVAARPRFVLEVAVPAGVPVPEIETPLLTSRPWAGVVHELDMRVHVGNIVMAREYTAAQRHILTETVCSLALWDFELADCLLDQSPERLSDPLRRLAEYGTDRGWAGPVSAEWTLGTEQVFEGAREVHSAWAVLHGRIPIVMRRLWEGQARIVLPMLDRNRRALIRESFPKLARVLGASSPEALYELDFSELCRALESARADTTQLNWAHDLRMIRNQLAHLEVVSFSQLFHYQRWPK